MDTFQRPILRVCGISKTIRLHILRGKQVAPFTDVSFNVYPGEFVAIVGASGSGKSSVVKAIHRTYLTTAGSIFYETAAGSVVDLATLADADLIALRRAEIGYVSQFMRVEPRMPALDVVAMPLLRRGVDKQVARTKAADLLGEFNVDNSLWLSYPTLFSGGEQQRISIARALIGEPRLLLADEPTSALDSRNVARVAEALARAVRQGMTVVGIFHDVTLVERLANRIVVMENGRVKAQGRFGEVEIPSVSPIQESTPRL